MSTRSPGRRSEDPAGELALEILCDHVKAPADLSVQVTVEIRDLADYHKRALPS